jgi:putative MATE family efflux protein
MQQRKDLTKGSIPLHIRNIAVPASIGFFFQTMYNVVDTYFGGKLSTEALAAMSLSFPIFFIILAIGNGISTGSSALISNALGAQDQKKANQYAAQAVSFGFFFSIFLGLIGLTIAPTLCRILGAQGTYLEMALSYINIIFYAAPCFILLHVFNASMIAQGDTAPFRNILIGGFFLNLILDPWFMYGGLGVPGMGLSGIALATVIITFFQMIYMYYQVKNTGILTLKLEYLKPRMKIYKDIIKQGFPASVNMMTIALGIFVITFYLSKFGQEAVAAYGVTTRIEQIILLPTIGLNMACMAIVGQNNGAGLMERVKLTYKKALKYSLYLISFGSICIFIFPEPIIRIFTQDTAVIDIAIIALRVAAFIGFTYPLMSISISTLQGLKRPMYALYLGIGRQLIGPFILFSLFLYYFQFGIESIWFGILGMNWASALVTLGYTYIVLKKEDIR